MNRLRSAKLKPSKCHFLRQSVEFLGHMITPAGIRPNPKQVMAVREFLIPQSVSQVRQFLGLTSYYRRFIGKFAKIASPLHELTRKGMEWHWTDKQQEAFDMLKTRLIESPILAYPNFKRGFVLETDASVKGLGAVLSQGQEDQRLHPVAYASRALSAAEKNYSITELETLAVVWAISHFRAYLYGHEVKVLTDHTAVKTILGAPNLSGKHARWWSKVYGSGVGEVQIAYRPGKENDRADALSRNPVLPSTAGEVDLDARVTQVVTTTDLTISDLLTADPLPEACPNDFHLEQRKDAKLKQICE